MDPIIKYSIKGLIFIIIFITGVIYYVKNSNKIMILNTDSSISIPIIKGALILKSFPRFRIFHNNLDCEFHFYPNKIKYNILTRRFAYYSDIELITISNIGSETFLQIMFRESLLGCSFVVSKEEYLRYILQEFKKRQCPLSPEAINEFNTLNNNKT